jgi:hypothetical protein
MWRKPKTWVKTAEGSLFTRSLSKNSASRLMANLRTSGVKRSGMRRFFS